MANVENDEEVQTLKRASCVQPNAGALERQQAGFGGQQVDSWLSFSGLGCRSAGKEVTEALGRFLQVGKACVRSALAGRVGWLLAGRWTLYK
jgi:hypothetical protein